MSKRRNISSLPLESSSSSSELRSPKERTEVLRSLLKETESITAINISPKTLARLKNIIRDADIIHNETTIEEKTTYCNEVIIDAKLMASSSQILETGTSKITQTVSNYDYPTFAERILRFVHTSMDTIQQEPDWLLLSKEISPQIMKTPRYSTLLGCLDPIEKAVVVKRQSTQREKREAQAPTRKPEAVVTIDDDDHSVEETVKKILLLVNNNYKRNQTPIDYFRLVLHPLNFGKTVENMLHVSFLVRDGVFKMLLDDNGNLVIMPSTKEMRNEFKKQKKSNTQNVFALNVDQWKTLVQTYRIEEPTINFG